MRTTQALEAARRERSGLISGSANTLMFFHVLAQSANRAFLVAHDLFEFTVQADEERLIRGMKGIEQRSGDIGKSLERKLHLMLQVRVLLASIGHVPFRTRGFDAKLAALVVGYPRPERIVRSSLLAFAVESGTFSPKKVPLHKGEKPFFRKVSPGTAATIATTRDNFTIGSERYKSHGSATPFLESAAGFY